MSWCGPLVVSLGAAWNVEPGRKRLVGAVFGYHSGWIKGGPGVGVSAEQLADGLLFGACIGAQIPGDVDECAEQLWVPHGQIDSAGAPHGPADDAPVGSVRTDAEVRNQV